MTRSNTASFEGQSPDPDRALALAREAMEAWIAENPGRQITRAAVEQEPGMATIKVEFED